MRKMTAIKQSKPKKKKQRVAAYCRVSTDRTEQQHSFEMQRAYCQKAYENSFDLNVGLDSVQVTYDADQRGYTTETVDSDPDFAGMAATVVEPLTEGSTVTWADNAGVPAPANP